MSPTSKKSRRARAAHSPRWVSICSAVTCCWNGCRVDGSVSRSVISPGVYVAPNAVVRDSIVMNDSVIAAGAVVERAIIDKQVTVGARAYVGYGDDHTPNQHMPQRLNTGISLI